MENVKVGIGLSGGINSAGVLCWLIESGIQPSEVHLFYAHLKEHSPDTFRFVADQIRYARKHFDNVKVKVIRNSVLEFFRKENMIPHPKVSPCTDHLKIEPMERYWFENGVQIDLIGYVRTELRRVRRMEGKGINNLFLTKQFPISQFTDEWCFEIVDRHIGWHPGIYDIRDAKGKRVFKHNNCLPCKNMYVKDMLAVAEHYPEYMKKAQQLSGDLKAYWGRDADDYYTTFGKEDYEAQCEICTFD